MLLACSTLQTACLTTCTTRFRCYGLGDGPRLWVRSPQSTLSGSMTPKVERHSDWVSLTSSQLGMMGLTRVNLFGSRYSPKFQRTESWPLVTTFTFISRY